MGELMVFPWHPPGASNMLPSAPSPCPGQLPPRLRLAGPAGLTSRARSGKMWPGRLKSWGCAAGSASARSVAARSDAEMPVLVPTRRSTVTVKAVYMASSFSAEETMRGMRRRSRSSPSMPTHTTPLVCRTMKAIVSGLTRSAAQIRSPSFSRSSSSSTTTASPAAMAASASGMESKPGAGRSRERPPAAASRGEYGAPAATTAAPPEPAAARRMLLLLLEEALLLLGGEGPLQLGGNAGASACRGCRRPLLLAALLLLGAGAKRHDAAGEAAASAAGRWVACQAGPAPRTAGCCATMPLVAVNYLKQPNERKVGCEVGRSVGDG